MSDYFFDTSALAKRYLLESGSVWVRKIADDKRHIITVSSIIRVEIASAVARRVREGSLPAEASVVLDKQVKIHLRNEYLVVPLVSRVIESAVELLYEHPLRSYDAVQLASGLEAHRHAMAISESSVIFVSADQRLLEIAEAVGLSVENPNTYA